MFYHMRLAAKELYERDGRQFEIAVYRVDEDGSLRGYVSLGGFSDRVLGMSETVAIDMKHVTGMDPVAEVVKGLKNEIDTGKYDFVLPV
jgi:hypothetical protein